MANELDPQVDQWYMHLDKGEMFRVVAVDTVSGGAEIQCFGGDVEELDMEAWRDLDIDIAAAPEDWTGPYDDAPIEDLGVAETGMRSQDWRASLEANRPAEESWSESSGANEEDDEPPPAGVAEKLAALAS